MRGITMSEMSMGEIVEEQRLRRASASGSTAATTRCARSSRTSIVGTRSDHTGNEATAGVGIVVELLRRGRARPQRAGRQSEARRVVRPEPAQPGRWLAAPANPSVLVTAASSDRASGRRTWQGNRDRRLRGAVRSARARCRRSGTARTRRRARTATPWHRSARCRPRPPTREQTCSGWPPSGQLPPLSRTSRPPAGAVAPGTPGNASRCRRRTRPRRPRHRLRPGAGHRGALDRGWRRPESRRRRPSCRRGRHRRPRRAHRGARCEDREARCEGRRSGDVAVEDEDAVGGRRRGRGRRQLVAEGHGDRRDDDEQAGGTDPANPNPTGRCSCSVCCGPRRPVKAAWCCQHVCGFRYADDMRRL